MIKPVFGTSEWASENANFIDGCSHNCKYCYAKEMAIRFRRKTSENWDTEKVRKTALNKVFNNINGTIMFPSSHDIHPGHLKEALCFLEKILSAGNKVLIVSKPHFECIKSICDMFFDYRHQILFRFTVGSANTKVLKFWEPGAPSFKERVRSLQYANEKQFQTSVSCEPMLDDNIEDLIKKVLSFVTDAIWIGKANFLIRRLKMNGFTDSATIKKANALLEIQTDENIKKLYNKYKSNPKIKWKESIKKIVGLDVPVNKGLDI